MSLSPWLDWDLYKSIISVHVSVCILFCKIASGFILGSCTSWFRSGSHKFLSSYNCVYFITCVYSGLVCVRCIVSTGMAHSYYKNFQCPHGCFWR